MKLKIIFPLTTVKLRINTRKILPTLIFYLKGIFIRDWPYEIQTCVIRQLKILNMFLELFWKTIVFLGGTVLESRNSFKETWI